MTGGRWKPSALPPSCASLPPLKIESLSNAPMSPCDASTETFVLSNKSRQHAPHAQEREVARLSLTASASGVSSALSSFFSGPPFVRFFAARAAAMMGDMAPIPQRCWTEVSVLPSFSTMSPIWAVM